MDDAEFPNPNPQNNDTEIDYLSKIARFAGPGAPYVLEDGQNYTGINLAGFIPQEDSMSIATATCTGSTGTLAGKTLVKGAFYPGHFTQLQLSGGWAYGIKCAENGS